MRVFLSGGTGFIGSHLARRLVGDGCQVGLLARPGADLRRVADIVERVTPIRGDLLDAATVRAGVARFQPEVALHLAWYTASERYWEAPENLAYLAGSLALVQALDDAGCRRLVLVGTGAEYDPDAGGHYADDGPVRPRTLYAASKHALWLVAERFAAARGRTAAVARLFQVYGPEEPDGRLVPVVIKSLLAGQPCRLTAGAQRRDFVHVEDVAEALAAIARARVEGAVNVGTSTAVPVADVARAIARLLDRPDLLRLGALPARPGTAPCVAAERGRLRDLLGWRPRYDLVAGLRQTIDWWRRQADAAEPLPGLRG